MTIDDLREKIAEDLRRTKIHAMHARDDRAYFEGAEAALEWVLEQIGATNTSAHVSVYIEGGIDYYTVEHRVWEVLNDLSRTFPWASER
jgi:biotin synthase-related radical SAM superfamily protein